MRIQLRRVLGAALAFMLAGSSSYGYVTDVKAEENVISLETDQNGVYLIYDEEDLIEYIKNADTGIDGKLMANISFEEDYEDTGFGNEEAYDIEFDGNGHTISYFNVNNSYYSLFYYIQNSTIKNLVLDVNILDLQSDTFGTLAVNAYSSNFINCVSNGEIFDEREAALVGGIVGAADSCEFKKCINRINITAFPEVGGIVAAADSVIIEECENYGELRSNFIVGGIAGDIKKSEINSCTNRGNLNTYDDFFEGYEIGGIVGICEDSSITNCKNTATISSVSELYGSVAGIVSSATDNSIVSDCVNDGNVSNPNNGATGGIIGGIFLESAKVSGCINNGAISGEVTVGGIVGTTYYNITKVLIEDCVNSGSISGVGTVGGIAGMLESADVIHCSNNGYIYAEVDVAGICGKAEASSFDEIYNAGKIIEWETESDALVNGDVNTVVTNEEANHTHCFDVEESILPATWLRVIPNVIMKANGKIAYVCKCGYNNGTDKVIERAEEILLPEYEIKYTGAEMKFPQVTVKDAKGNVIGAENYSVTWVKQSTAKYVDSIDEAGAYYAVVTFDGKYYCGFGYSNQLVVTKEQTTVDKKEEETTSDTKVTVKKSKVTKTKRTSKTKAKITINKVKGATSYEIQVSSSSKFKAGKTRTIKTTKETKTIKKLKAGKKYYVRVRSVKKINGKKHKSDWSKKRTISSKVGKSWKAK